ncbi:unnamed protein product [Caenorhabditis sp. 36 PRJEB53466]|nr:unnamed protein product [Caenorhabditis sp. 36 PRJEB53466]
MKKMSGVSNETQERLRRYNEELAMLSQRKDELRGEINTLSATVNEIEKERDSCRSELSKLAKESTTLPSIAFEAETRVRREEEELRRLLATKTNLFPQTLPCGHTVCYRCREHLKSERIGLDRYSTCPVCRQPFNFDRPYPAQDLLTKSPSFIHFK